ncbi:MAG: hypothetical protein EOP02_22840 [Proteobacteria bacterium]|nr:MAG: hypothetical protein EOP02_22840 [Pseudomonadota bacterium]
MNDMNALNIVNDPNNGIRVSRAIALPLLALSALMLVDAAACSSIAEAAIGVIGLVAAFALGRPQHVLSQTPSPSAG